jgi:hypothetical protein
MSGTDKTIGEFGGWDDSSQQHDFFGETNLEVDVVDIALKDEAKTEEDKEKIKKEEEEEKIVDEQFKDFETGIPAEDEEEEKTSTKKPVSSVTNSKQTLEFLKEKGLVDYELEEGKELTEELAENLLEDSWENALDTAIEETIKELPQEVKDLIKFASKGGDVNQLLAKMATQAVSGINKNSDISSEEVQVAAISADLFNQGYDQEYIDSQIEFLKDSNKLEAIATKAFNKIVAKQEQETESEVTQAKLIQENRKKQAREYRSTITSHINTLSEVGGLPISKQDRSVLPSYISEPNVELQDGRVVSEMQADLFKVMADKDKITLLAKLLKSDFDFSAIARKQQTAATRDIKSKVENAEKIKTVSSEGVHKPSKRAIWDMID